MCRLTRSSLAVVLLLAVAAGCTISREYVGTPLPSDSVLALRPGESTMGEVLTKAGAPNRIMRGPKGHIFVYRHVQRNSDTLTLEEPVITNFEFFSYTVVKEMEDRLVVLFDNDGIVTHYGIWLGTADLDELVRDARPE